MLSSLAISRAHSAPRLAFSGWAFLHSGQNPGVEKLSCVKLVRFPASYECWLVSGCACYNVSWHELLESPCIVALCLVAFEAQCKHAWWPSWPHPHSTISALKRHHKKVRHVTRHAGVRYRKKAPTVTCHRLFLRRIPKKSFPTSHNTGGSGVGRENSFLLSHQCSHNTSTFQWQEGLWIVAKREISTRFALQDVNISGFRASHA